METIIIPDVPVNASRIGLGTWAIGGWMWGGTEESEAISTIHAAFDKGINLIDTAPVYGFGRSEELVGKALAGGRREGAIAVVPLFRPLAHRHSPGMLQRMVSSSNSPSSASDSTKASP